MLEVAADLVPASGGWRYVQQRVAARWITVHTVGQFDFRQALKKCLCRPQDLGSVRIAGIFCAAQEGRRYASPEWRYATDHCQVFLADLLPFEQGREPSCGFQVESEQNYTGGRLVEPMYRMDLPADLLAHALKQKLAFVCVESRAMDQQSRGFVDRHQMFILKQDGNPRHPRGMPTIRHPCFAGHRWLALAAAVHSRNLVEDVEDGTVDPPHAQHSACLDRRYDESARLPPFDRCVTRAVHEMAPDVAGDTFSATGIHPGAETMVEMNESSLGGALLAPQGPKSVERREKGRCGRCGLRVLELE